MSREYPDWLDPWKAAEGHRTLAGSMPLKRMPRLQPLLANSEGEVRFSAAFEFDQQARVTINVAVDGQLPLICQRSLEQYLEPVHRQSVGGVIENIGEEAMMPENYEPVLVENRRLALLDLVEDELLLSLPQVPRKQQLADAGDVRVKDGQETVQTGGVRREEVRQPFAGLAEQMKRHAEAKKQGR
jgi:uncharacterized protein